MCTYSNERALARSRTLQFEPRSSADERSLAATVRRAMGRNGPMDNFVRKDAPSDAARDAEQRKRLASASLQQESSVPGGAIRGVGHGTKRSHHTKGTGHGGAKRARGAPNGANGGTCGANGGTRGAAGGPFVNISNINSTKRDLTARTTGGPTAHGTGGSRQSFEELKEDVVFSDDEFDDESDGDDVSGYYTSDSDYDDDKSEGYAAAYGGGGRPRRRSREISRVNFLNHVMDVDAADGINIAIKKARSALYDGRVGFETIQKLSKSVVDGTTKLEWMAPMSSTRKPRVARFPDMLSGPAGTTPCVSVSYLSNSRRNCKKPFTCHDASVSIEAFNTAQKIHGYPDPNTHLAVYAIVDQGNVADMGMKTEGLEHVLLKDLHLMNKREQRTRDDDAPGWFNISTQGRTAYQPGMKNIIKSKARDAALKQLGSKFPDESETLLKHLASLVFHRCTHACVMITIYYLTDDEIEDQKARRDEQRGARSGGRKNKPLWNSTNTAALVDFVNEHGKNFEFLTTLIESNEAGELASMKPQQLRNRWKHLLILTTELEEDPIATQALLLNRVRELEASWGRVPKKRGAIYTAAESKEIVEHIEKHGLTIQSIEANKGGALASRSMTSIQNRWKIMKAMKQAEPPVVPDALFNRIQMLKSLARRGRPKGGENKPKVV